MTYTVNDLMRDLLKFPGNTPVMVRGITGGYDDATPPQIKKVRRDVTTPMRLGASGPHEAHDSGEPTVVVANFGTGVIEAT